MPRVFLGNFDFEHELAAGNAYRPTATVRRLNAALASAWIPVAAEDDAVLVEAPLADGDLPELRKLGMHPPRFVSDPGALNSADRWELVPWGWTGGVVALAKKQGWQFHCPDLALIRKLNSRSFRLQLERDWGVGLPEARAIHACEELAAAVEGASRNEWVIKANFGMAARERMRWRGDTVPDHVMQWAGRRLKDEPVLVLEPWVERLAEAGIQIDIPEQGTPRLVGVTPLLTDESGGYVGSRIHGSDENAPEWSEAVAVAQRVARRLQEEGYYGPLGIDAMRYRDETGRECLRPLQDLNARCTMGRLALGFRRVLRDRECAAWLHFAWPRGPWDSLAAWREALLSRLATSARVIATSPEPDANHGPARCSVLVIVSSAEELSGAERAFHSLQ